jgi:hypothetical protein
VTTAYQPKHAKPEGEPVEQIIADAEELIADLEALARELAAEGKTEEAHVVQVIMASWAALTAELKKLI